jgi:muramoyltetrapeptide carboxypeptidase
MSGGYLPDEQDLYATQSIYDLLFGKKVEYSIASHFLNRNGKAEGILCGGNLALLSDLIGTKSDIDTNGKILFIEDIGEYLYNIDRMMWQLKRAGKLSTLAGLLVGGFTDIKDNPISFGMQVYDIVYEKVKEYSYPVCFAFPVGHQKLNYALKCGANYQLEVQAEQVLLREILERGEL